MKKLSKEKRQQLVLVVLLTVGALAGLWFGVIRAQKQSLQRLHVRREDAAQHLKQVKLAVDNADSIEARLAQASKRLTKVENHMASGDIYSWSITAIRQFRAAYRVDIPQFSQIDGPKDVSLLPGFPYKEAALTIGGTAQFYDFGRFIADFENQFPYARILNLSLDAASSLGGTDSEKLSFKMDIVTLVKPNAS